MEGFKEVALMHVALRLLDMHLRVPAAAAPSGVQDGQGISPEKRAVAAPGRGEEEEKENDLSVLFHQTQSQHPY